MPSEDGKDESKYCGYYNQGSCSICQRDSSSSWNRFPDKMNDPYPDTFWHSEPWPKKQFLSFRNSSLSDAS
ncbi:unnamed protein product [Oikopleura dioica]|nr:unnamed protein product [Oikopleura dioica]